MEQGNVIGEFAEKLVAEYYNAEQLNASSKGADLKTLENKLIQVKSRRLKKIESTKLNVIRSWDFDILVVVLFSNEGNVLKAIEINSKDAREISAWDNHQNGDYLKTNKDLLNHLNSKDITNDLQAIINGGVVKKSGLIKKMKSNDEKTAFNAGSDFELELIPNDENSFKEEILRTKKAKRTWYYKNGKNTTDIWNANKLSITLGIKNNIKTNHKVKQRKELGLIKLKVEIIE